MCSECNSMAAVVGIGHFVWREYRWYQHACVLVRAFEVKVGLFAVRVLGECNDR